MPKFYPLQGSHFTRAQAETYGPRMAAIYERDGALNEDALIEDARRIRSPLHDAFTWDDAEAGRIVRRQEAQALIGNIIIDFEKSQDDESPELRIRSFFRIQEIDGYKSLDDIKKSPDQCEELLRQERQRMDSQSRRLTDLSVYLAPKRQSNVASAVRHIDRASSELFA